MPEKPKPLLVDIRIPYCVRPEKYQFGTFAVGTNEEKNAYMAALKEEVLSYAGDLAGYEICAVRLSGGSATVMSPDLLGALLKTVRESLPVAKGSEISFDAHPLTIGTPALTGIAAGRPNRAELYMRSADDRELETCGCAFSMQQVTNAVLFFRKFGLNNLGLCITLGIPGQTDASFRETLHACVIMGTEHLRIVPARLDEACEEEASWKERYLSTVSYLTENGYLAYGAGLFCKPHHGSIFELQRFAAAPVLGIGAGNVSVIDGSIYRNTNNLRLYVRSAGDITKRTAKAYTANAAFAMEEYVRLHLLGAEGIRRELFAERFGTDLPEEISKSLEQRVEKGLLTCEAGHFQPTPEGAYSAWKEQAGLF